MGRWGGTGPDSGAEGRFADLPGESETEPEGLREALAWHYPFSLSSQTPPSSPPPSSRGGAWTRRPGRRPPGGPPAPAALHPAAPVRGGGAGTHPGPAGHSPAPGHAVSPLDTDTPEGQRRSWSAWCPAASSPPSRGAAADPGQLSAFFNSPLGRRWRRPPCAAGNSNFPCCCRRRSSAPAWSRGEEVLLQGVVDAWFETLEGITVVDFKSDRVSRSGRRPGRGVPPSAGGVQPGPGGDHRKTGVPKGALVLRTGGADPSVKGRQKGREKVRIIF